MKRKYDNVYQFKITLKVVKPPVWRRIQVPETYTFWDLHVAIQDAMGWADYHLHEFEMINPRTMGKELIGMPDEDSIAYGQRILCGWRQKISAWFFDDNNKAQYRYDFGDGWQHTIKLESIFPRAADILYPQCVAGSRACPPEDCGGPWGYENMLEIIDDKHHKEHESMMEWLGGSFDPEGFEPSQVKFDDPSKRFKIAFEID